MKNEEIDALSMMYGIEQDDIKKECILLAPLYDISNDSMNKVKDVIKGLKDETEVLSLLCTFFSVQLLRLPPDIRNKILNLISKEMLTDMEKSLVERKELFKKLKNDRKTKNNDRL